MKKTIFIMLVVFAAGWLLSSGYSAMNIVDDAPENPSNSSAEPVIDWVDAPEDQLSPYDHIKEDQIHVYPDRIIIDIEGAEWSRFTDTNSMDPVIDKGANAIRIAPASADNIHVGDIVSYRSRYADGIIIHRVIEIGEDDNGWFCKVKGDNNKYADPGKIRFDQIVGITIGIFY